MTFFSKKKHWSKGLGLLVSWQFHFVCAKWQDKCECLFLLKWWMKVLFITHLQNIIWYYLMKISNKIQSLMHICILVSWPTYTTYIVLRRVNNLIPCFAVNLVKLKDLLCLFFFIWILIIQPWGSRDFPVAYLSFSAVNHW